MHQIIVILKRISLNEKVMTMMFFELNPNVLEGRTMYQTIVKKSNVYDNYSNSSKSSGKKKKTHQHNVVSDGSC